MTDFPRSDDGRPEDLDDLLAGRSWARPLDDRLRAALRNLRNDLVRPPAAETSQRHLTVIHEAARSAAHTVTSPRYGWRTRLGQLAAATTVKVVIGTTAAAAATGGLAATGNLPAPAQRVAVSVAATVGVRLPADTKLNRSAEIDPDGAVESLQAIAPPPPAAEEAADQLGPVKTPQVPEGVGVAPDGSMTAETAGPPDGGSTGETQNEATADAPLIAAPTATEASGDSSSTAPCTTTSPDTSDMDEDSSTSADTAPEPAPSETSTDDGATSTDDRTSNGKANGHEKQGVAEGTGTNSGSSDEPSPAPSSSETTTDGGSDTSEDPCAGDSGSTTTAASTGTTETTDDDSEPQPYEGSGSAVAPSGEES